jgi:hypothetical protein
MTEQKAEREPAQDLPQPLRTAASVLSRVPGAGMVTKVAEETLDKVGAVSPRGRRLAVYTGAGVLGVAGVVEWPVAVTGAAVAWLTQPRGKGPQERAVESPAGSSGRSGGSGTSAGEEPGEAPTPRVMASAPASLGEHAAPPETPSDKLPAHTAHPDRTTR